MKTPDLAQFDNAEVTSWTGAVEPLHAAAAHAQLRFSRVNLASIKDKAGLMSALASALKLPEHFGHNFDALADSLEDRECVGKKGCVVVLEHAAAFRKAHPGDWKTLNEILDEAVEFWKERLVAFWVFVT
jgi:RNAse (barnase) inhibitor barstar